MSKQIVLAEIRHIVETLKEQQEQISAHEGTIPRIEIDIMMGNVRRLYESLCLLSKEAPSNRQTVIRQEVITIAPQIISQPPVTVPEVSETNQTNAALNAEADVHESNIFTATGPEAEAQKSATPVYSSSHASGQTPEAETQESATPVYSSSQSTAPAPAPAPAATPPLRQPEELLAAVETKVNAPVTEIHHEEEMTRAAVSSTVRKKATAPTASLFDEAESLGDTITAKPTIYDTIAAQAEDKSIGRKLQSEPVTDLKKSIGINEKFSFINELFDGDLDSYNRAIEKLNNFEGIGPALVILEGEFVQQHSWNVQSNAYLNLRRLVERRYS